MRNGGPSPQPPLGPFLSRRASANWSGYFHDFGRMSFALIIIISSPLSFVMMMASRGRCVADLMCRRTSFIQAWVILALIVFGDQIAALISDKKFRHP
jgi:hypothetical protein